MKDCPACGAENADDAEHCAHCPASFPPPSAAGAPERHPTTVHAMRARLPHVPSWTWALIAAAAGVLLHQARPRGAAPPPDALPAFDPARDAARDLDEARARARVAGKRVLVEVGGNWCLWCRRMDEFFASHPDLARLRETGFVTVKVSVTPERSNAAALAGLPTVESYPHFFVLEPDGRLVVSQDTGELEAGDSYDAVRFEGFLTRNAPPR